jgi:integral membrane sensor domain MASE1
MLLASDFNSMPALVAAFLVVGLAYGGEGDILGYLAVRYFGIEVYSTVLGCVTAAIGAAIALGSVLLSITLKGSGSFNTILICVAIGVALGSLIFRNVGHKSVRRYLGPEDNSTG